MRPFGATVLVALALFASACSSGEDGAAVRQRSDSGARATTPTAGGDAPSTGFPDKWQPVELDWHRCDVAPGAECAELEVPLDWDDPLGPTIDLALARTRATGDRIGSLLTNPGGPGASGLEHLGSRPFGPPVTERFDVVAWDPRGVGRSSPLRCGSGVAELQSLDPEPDDAEEQRELEEAAAAVSAECRELDAEVLPHLGTDDVAFDMEAIRRALGDEPLNYIGFSYGTHLGQVYAARFPDRIRAMVLDAIVDPTLGYEEMLIEQAVAFDRSFERHAAACARTPSCGVDDLGRAYDQVLAMVEREPLETASGTPAGPSELATAAIVASYVPDGWQTLGPALAAALEGDGTLLASLADAYRDFGGFSTYVAVVCIDSPPPRGVEAYRDFAARAAAAAPRFGAAVANELLPCATWPAEPVGEPEAITAEGAPPILVVGNTGDAATPYENAVAVADRLASGVLVTVDIDGHVAYGVDRCLTELVDDHLVHLEVPPPGTRCG